MSNVWWYIQKRWMNKWIGRFGLVEFFIAAIATIILAISWAIKSDAMEYQKIHLCISTARELNQNLATNYNPQSCVNNPNYLN